MKLVVGAAARRLRAGASRFGRVLACLTVAAMLAAAPLSARAGEPAAPESVISTFNATLLHVMQNAKDLGYQGRYDALAAVMNKGFDFAGMTRVAVGPTWNSLSSIQQSALIAAFQRFSIATYATQFDDYSGEQMRIDAPPQPNADGVLVPTTLTPPNGDAVRFGYVLHKVDGAWRIIDIYLDGTISQLAVRRSEFRSVLARSGPEGLVQLLDEKAKKLAMT